MNKIGFTNFRRFSKLEPIEYKGVTFLVGRNNSGKSTLVKALLLIDHYFKSGKIDTLSFGNSILEDANIVTYGRAKNKHASGNFIQFTQQIENYVFDLTLSGEDDKDFAQVQMLKISDIDSGLVFMFNMQARFVSVIKAAGTKFTSISLEVLSDLEIQIQETKEDLKVPGLKKTSKEYIELISKLESQEKKLASIAENNYQSISTPKTQFAIDYYFGNAQSFMQIVDDLLLYAMALYERDFYSIQNGQPASEKFEDLRALKELDPVFVQSSFSHFDTLMKDFSVVYMGANPVKQSALFAIRDKSNALAQAIHEFKQLSISEGEEEHRFVLKWMNEFDVGENFKISMYAGESYEMQVNSYQTDIHLADKGMGSIQAMLLIMRIACVIRRIKLAEENSTVTRIVEGKEVKQESPNYRLIDNTTIIIEEPELNLHPALQSKLADLFLDVHQKFKIDFLIETHSEYILRRSQVLVAENEFEVAPNENPFCVHYFPKDINQQPYRLDYEATGRFNRNFGDGFFDEATNSTMTLLKLQRSK